MLKNKRIAFIGVGMMGETLIRGLLKSKIVSKTNIIASDIEKDKLNRLTEELEIQPGEDNRKAVQNANIVILAVKPKDIKNVLDEIGQVISKEQLVISIAAGISTEFIERHLQTQCPAIRVMPNTPCLIGQGVSVICSGKSARREDIEAATTLFGAVGKVIEIEETLIDAVTALSGSGPAYVYVFLESLAEAAVKEGLSKDIAKLLAAQTILGAAGMFLETGKSLTDLKDMVTSPGGTTAAGLYALEKSGFRAAVMKAVHAAAKRAKELAGK